MAEGTITISKSIKAINISISPIPSSLFLILNPPMDPGARH
jgi:hypothetical protein